MVIKKDIAIHDLVFDSSLSIIFSPSRASRISIFVLVQKNIRFLGESLFLQEKQPSPTRIACTQCGDGNKLLKFGEA
ncbi:MAG: hypothetical protein A3E80_02475 [Chlamydiae bacterium RIFCSPHIGHO2_12_FULL_49_9]|nr:MAG: hypothetical protein A3E80_02475 [Chlamydiae bacterium RIFCSPHIGHO2_12_FULL_49_9]